MDFHGMKRKQLQSLCKKHGIPANLKNSEMADRLSSILKEIEKPEGVEQSPPTDVVEMDRGTHPKDLPRRVKKVRFSPDNETFLFISSDAESTEVKKRPVRRKCNKKGKKSALVSEFSEETEDSVGDNRVLAVRTRRTREGRAAGVNRASTDIIDPCDEPPVVGASECVGEPIGRQLRSRRRARVEKNVEFVPERKSRKRFLEKVEACNSNGSERLTRLSKPSVVESKVECTGRVTRSRARAVEKASESRESIEEVRVWAETESGNGPQLRELPRGLARKTRNSIALYKGTNEATVSDEVRHGRSHFPSISEEKEAAVLLGEKANGHAVENNAKIRSKTSVAKEGSLGSRLCFESVSNDLLPRRSRRCSVMSPLLTSGEFAVKKIAYPSKQHEPVVKEGTHAKQNEPSGRTTTRGSKRNPPRSSSLAPEKMAVKAATKKQKRVSRTESAEVTAAPESESTVVPIEKVNLEPELNAPETDLVDVILDIQGKGCEIGATASEEVTFMEINAGKAEEEEERVALVWARSLITEDVDSKAVLGEGNEKEESVMDTGEDIWNEVGSLHEGEPSSVPSGLEKSSGTEPFAIEQEIYGESIQVDDHFVAGYSNSVQGNGQNFKSQELAFEEQKDDVSENGSSRRKPEEVLKETKEIGYLDGNSTEETAGSVTPDVREASINAEGTVDRGVDGDALLAENEEHGITEGILEKAPFENFTECEGERMIESPQENIERATSILSKQSEEAGTEKQLRGSRSVSSADVSATVKFGSPVALKMPLNLGIELNVLETPNRECVPNINPGEVTNSIQGNGSQIEEGAVEELCSADLNAQNSEEEECDASRSVKCLAIEQMDSKTIPSEDNGSAEMPQDVSEDDTDETHSLHADKLVELQAEEHDNTFNGSASYPLAAPLHCPGSSDSVQGYGQSPSLQSVLKDQFEELREIRSSGKSFRDMIEEAEGRESAWKSTKKTNVFDSDSEHQDISESDIEVCKDGTSSSDTREGMGNQEQNTEEMLKEENEEEKALSFSRERSETVEQWPKEDQQTGEMPIPYVAKPGLQFQFEQDEEAVSHTAPVDNRVDKYACSTAAFQTPANVNIPLFSSWDLKTDLDDDKHEGTINPDDDEHEGTINSDDNDHEVLVSVEDGGDGKEPSEEEMMTEDGKPKGLHLGRESVGFGEVSLNGESSAGQMSLSYVGKSGPGFETEEPVDYNCSETRNASSCKTPSAEARIVYVDDSESADFAFQGPCNVGSALFSSLEQAVSPDEDEHEDEKGKEDQEHSPEAKDTSMQVELSAERRSNATNVKVDSLVLQPDEREKLCSPELLAATRSCLIETFFEDLHSKEPVEEASPNQRFSASGDVMDTQCFKELDSEACSSSEMHLEEAACVGKEALRSAENYKMEQAKEPETGELALTNDSENNAVTASTALELSEIKMANVGDNNEATREGTGLADFRGASNNFSEKVQMMEHHSEINLGSVEAREEENAQIEQNSTMSLHEFNVREISEMHELLLNALDHDSQPDKEDVRTDFGSYSHMLLIDVAQEEMQNPGIDIAAATITDGGEYIRSNLLTCEEVTAQENFHGDEATAKEQSMGDETAPKGKLVGNKCIVMDQTALGTAEIAEETTDETFVLNANSLLERGKGTKYSTISPVRSSSNCEDKASDGDSQLFTSPEILLFHGDKTDGTEEFVSEAIDAGLMKEDAVDFEDKSPEMDTEVIIPKYGDLEDPEDEQVEAEHIFKHETEEVHGARTSDPVVPTEQIHAEASPEILLFHGDKTDGTEEFVSEAIDAGLMKEDAVDIEDKSPKMDTEVIIPKYGDLEDPEDEQVEAAHIFKHETEEILGARISDPVVPTEQIHAEAIEGTLNEQEDNDDALAMIKEYIDREEDRDASTKIEILSRSVNKESSQECAGNTLAEEAITVSLVEVAEVEQDELFKNTSLSESALTTTNPFNAPKNLFSTPKKMPIAFEGKENIFVNTTTKEEQLGGRITTAFKTSTRGRKALEELLRYESQQL